MSAIQPDTNTQARIHDLAKEQAHQLRREAVDDFWRGADAAWRRSLQSGQAAVVRSAARLQARLARHTRTRGSRLTTTGV